MNRQAVMATAHRLGPTLTAKEAIDAGLEWRDLYALRDEGIVIEVSRGVYRLREAGATPYLDLVAVSRRAPNGTICLVSALSYWDLTDEIPSAVHMAIPRGSWPPSIAFPPTRVHVFAAPTFQLGRERSTTEAGDSIVIYSPERSIVDALRFRNRVGSDLAYASLRRYLESPGSSPRTLLEYARQLRAESVVGSALEVLTS